MYYRAPRGPLPEEQRLSEIAMHIASIAIEKWKNEQALRESEQRSRAVLRAIPIRFSCWTPISHYLECEPRTSCQVPIPRDQLIGKNMRDVLPPELAERFACVFKRAAESGELQFVEYDFPSTRPDAICRGPHRTRGRRSVPGSRARYHGAQTLGAGGERKRGAVPACGDGDSRWRVRSGPPNTDRLEERGISKSVFAQASRSKPPKNGGNSVFIRPTESASGKASIARLKDRLRSGPMNIHFDKAMATTRRL